MTKEQSKQKIKDKIVENISNMNEKQLIKARNNISVSDAPVSQKGYMLELINARLERNAITSEAMIPLAELSHSEIMGGN
jgi:hypothetical protein